MDLFVSEHGKGVVDGIGATLKVKNLKVTVLPNPHSWYWN